MIEEGAKGRGATGGEPRAAPSLPSSTIEVARNRPKNPLNDSANEGDQRSRQIMRVSKMVRHDLELLSEDELLSLHEPDTVDSAESATNTDRLREQLYSSQRLNEYYNQVVAEIRASLERAEKEEEASSDAFMVADLTSP